MCTKSPVVESPEISGLQLASSVKTPFVALQWMFVHGLEKYAASSTPGSTSLSTTMTLISTIWVVVLQVRNFSVHHGHHILRAADVPTAGDGLETASHRRITHAANNVRSKSLPQKCVCLLIVCHVFALGCTDTAHLSIHTAGSVTNRARTYSMSALLISLEKMSWMAFTRATAVFARAESVSFSVYSLRSRSVSSYLYSIIFGVGQRPECAKTKAAIVRKYENGEGARGGFGRIRGTKGFAS